MKTETTTALVAGDVVKFAQPMSDAEQIQRFVVVELRGPRVLVQDLVTDMAIKPQAVYLASDLVKA
jgi:hypothetical protein